MSKKKKTCYNCKFTDFFMGSIYCTNEASTYYTHKIGEFMNNDTYVTLYGQESKLCDLYKRRKK